METSAASDFRPTGVENFTNPKECMEDDVDFGLRERRSSLSAIKTFSLFGPNSPRALREGDDAENDKTGNEEEDEEEEEDDESREKSNYFDTEQILNEFLSENIDENFFKDENSEVDLKGKSEANFPENFNNKNGPYRHRAISRCSLSMANSFLDRTVSRSRHSSNSLYAALSAPSAANAQNSEKEVENFTSIETDLPPPFSSTDFRKMETPISSRTFSPSRLSRSSGSSSDASESDRYDPHVLFPPNAKFDSNSDLNSNLNSNFDLYPTVDPDSTSNFLSNFDPNDANENDDGDVDDDGSDSCESEEGEPSLTQVSVDAYFDPQINLVGGSEINPQRGGSRRNSSTERSGSTLSLDPQVDPSTTEVSLSSIPSSSVPSSVPFPVSSSIPSQLPPPTAYGLNGLRNDNGTATVLGAIEPEPVRRRSRLSSACEDAPAAFLCPITQELMADPVLVGTGQTYERSSIQKWLSQGHRTCPVTGLPLCSVALLPNYALRHAIQSYAATRAIPLKEPEAAPAQTATHYLPRGSVVARDTHVAGVGALWGRSVPDRESPAMVAVGMLFGGTAEEKDAALDTLCQLASSAGEEGRAAIVLAGGVAPLQAAMASAMAAEGAGGHAERAARCVRFLCRSNDSFILHAASGAIPFLVKLVDKGSPAAREAAAGALVNLSAKADINKVTIAAAGGAAPLVRMLSVGPGGRDVAAAALCNLAAEDDNRTAIVALRAIPPLIKLAAEGSVPGGGEYAVHALGSLACNSANSSEAIIRAGAIPVLLAMAASANSWGEEAGSRALRNLAATSAPLVLAAMQPIGGLATLRRLVEFGSARAADAATSTIQLLNAAHLGHGAAHGTASNGIFDRFLHRNPVPPPPGPPRSRSAASAEFHMWSRFVTRRSSTGSADGTAVLAVQSRHGTAIPWAAPVGNSSSSSISPMYPAGPERPTPRSTGQLAVRTAAQQGTMLPRHHFSA